MDVAQTVLADELAAGQASADNFLCMLLKGYAVASLGWWILTALDRVGSMKRACPHATCDPGYCHKISNSNDSNSDSESNSEGGTTRSAVASPSPPETVDELFPLAEAAHEITAEVDTAFCLYHYTHPSAQTPWYIIMMYDAKSSSFTYWCDQTPSWDVLQTTARKFVTENRCSALYACADVTTETESSGNGDDAIDGGGAPGETTENVSVEGQADTTAELTVVTESEEERKSLTTRIENVYVKIGRVSHFRTPEKAVPKNSEVNYKNFAVMRNRSSMDRLSTRP